MGKRKEVGMALKCQEKVMLPEQGSFELGFEESTEVCQTEKQEESHSRVYSH